MESCSSAALVPPGGYSEPHVLSVCDLQELDPVTLHNQALLNMDSKPTEGFEKLAFLLQQPSFPPVTFGNLLLLYCKHEVSVSLQSSVTHWSPAFRVDNKASACKHPVMGS